MNKITKAIILTAGYGTRRLPITKTIEKNMLPLGDRPIIDYVVEECALAGMTDIWLVVNDVANSQIKQYYEPNRELEQYLTERNATEKLAKLNTVPEGVRLHYVEQDINDKYGTAVPVALALAEIGADEQVVLCNGDDPFWGARGGSDVKTMIEAVQSPNESVTLGYQVPPDEIYKYGIWQVEGDFAAKIIEKPAVGTVGSALANINRVVISPQLAQTITAYVRDNNFGPNEQEYMLTDCYETYIKGGGVMRYVKNTGEWLDCGSLAGWLRANNVVAGDLLNNK
ncbi:MAG: NTP transferase domain-containing protein [Candidatus Nomurabacteria bacterium]|jgi:UTP--glucose-1-phosphate uridylyltransferase|nr:NTP transferase domain-containing protein [Candidatus Nomurabacteria bacterium]